MFKAIPSPSGPGSQERFQLIVSWLGFMAYYAYVFFAR
jgi:hypothetical protein